MSIDVWVGLSQALGSDQLFHIAWLLCGGHFDNHQRNSCLIGVVAKTNYEYLSGTLVVVLRQNA